MAEELFRHSECSKYALATSTHGLCLFLKFRRWAEGYVAVNVGRTAAGADYDRIHMSTKYKFSVLL